MNSDAEHATDSDIDELLDILEDDIEDDELPDPSTVMANTYATKNISEPQLGLLDVRTAGNNDFAANAITPFKHVAYAKAKNDPNLKIGQFYLVVSSTDKYKIIAVEDVCVNYGVGDIGEDESLSAAERAEPNRCRIPNTEVRELDVHEPQCNSRANCVLWVVKFPKISSKAIYGPTGGRKLKITGTLKCQDTTDGTICLVQINVATVAIKITTKESEAKGERKRKHDSTYGPSSFDSSISDLIGDNVSTIEDSDTLIMSSRPYKELIRRIAELEEQVKVLSQAQRVVAI